MKLSNISSHKIVSKIIKWGSQILFILSLAIMVYLSFVDDIGLTIDLQRLTTIGVVGVVLNALVWDTYYKKNYETVMQEDVSNSEKGKYSIHKRYYFARKGWKQVPLQNAIRQYNRDYIKAWIMDIEDLCGRTEKEIVTEPYKKHSHKWLIYRLKHRLYPKSGIKTSNDLMCLLDVSMSNSMRIDVRKSEHFAMKYRLLKLITSILSVALTASIVVTFLNDGWETAIITLLLNVIILFCSLFLGAILGTKGAKIKLSTVERVSGFLEEWKNEEPSAEPYSDTENIVPPTIENNEIVEEVKPEEVKPEEVKPEEPIRETTVELI